MPLFGQLNYGALFARRAFGLDQFLPADQEMARRGYPPYANDSGGGAGTPDQFVPLDQWGPLGQGLPPKAGAGAGPPNAGGPFPSLGLQTTRRTQLFGPLANLSVPRLF